MRSHEGRVAVHDRRCFEDPLSLAKIRRALVEAGAHDVHRLDDRSVCVLAAGRPGQTEPTRAIARPIRKAKAARPKDEPPPQRRPKPQPAPVRRSTATPEPDSHSHVNQDEQAQALEAAAQQGAPFCEECEKARQQQRASAGASAA